MNHKVRNIGCFFLICLLVLSLAGCSPTPLPEGMSKEQVLESGQQIAELIGTGKNQEVYDILRSDVAASLTPEDIASLLPEDAGAWQEITGSEAFGQTDQASNESYAVGVFVCQFENAKLRLSLSFDMDMNLIGIRVES